MDELRAVDGFASLAGRQAAAASRALGGGVGLKLEDSADAVLKR